MKVNHEGRKEGIHQYMKCISGEGVVSYLSLGDYFCDSGVTVTWRKTAQQTVRFSYLGRDETKKLIDSWTE